MKKLAEIIDDYLLPFVALSLGLGFSGLVFWFIWKVFSGAYHLLDKLIDKL